MTRRRAPHPEVAPPATASDALDRLTRLPVHTWTYGWEHPSVRHLGPMAQDFARTFGLGDRDDRIHHLDATGVLMASVQALHLRVVDLEAALDAQGRAATPVPDGAGPGSAA